MPEKSRYPSRDFSHRDYLSWINRVLVWLNTQIGQPDYPSHEVAELPGLIAALQTALNNWEALHGLASDRSKIFTDVFELLRKQLQLLKQIIPTVVDPHVLGSFGLDKELPRDRDELTGVAETCINRWNEIIGGGVPALWAPLEPQFNALITLFGDFEVARDNYYSSFNLAQQAQNDVLTARDACHAKERDIFNWYNGFHPDSQGEWWTGTEWGTSSGGSGGGGEEPQPGSWEDAPTNFVVSEGVAGSAVLQADIHPDAEGCAVFMAETDMSVAEPPMRPGEPVAPLITPLDPGKFSYNLKIKANRRVWFWICHVKDNAWGAMAGPEWIEVIK